MEELILIDGNSLLFKAFYATSYTGNYMVNRNGIPTNGVYGFARMVDKILDNNPKYVDGDLKYIEHFNLSIVRTPNKKPMRWSHLKELSERGHIIAAHTMDHYMINTGDTETLKHQIIDCKDIIEDKIGKECPYFAFPYGKLTQANQTSIKIACQTYKFVFSQSDYKEYFSFGGKVINRRHFEPFWPVNHVKYFLSCKKHF